MSDELNITAGGGISVDPDEMRAVAARMAAVADRTDAVAESARRAHQMLWQVPALVALTDLSGISDSARRAEELAAELRSDAEGTRLMGDAFELADLRARQELLGIGRPEEARVLQERIDELVASDDRLDAMAISVAAGWKKSAQEGLFDQWGDRLVGFIWPGIGLGVTSTMAEVRRNPHQYGMLPKGTRLRGPAAPVTVTEVARTHVSGAPRSLKQLAERIPKATAQIAVEKRQHRDGSESYEVYVDGTRGFALTEEPWDMGSNWDLYVSRREGASYEAVLEALEMAGAEPGAKVDVVGYSQGGAVVTPLAMSGLYETDRVTLIGSPTVPWLDADQQLIHITHTDDPVGSGLTGGGPAGTTGSADSITVSREYATGGEFTSGQSHFFDAYMETLGLAEASGDTRIDALDESLRDEAEDIVSVERMEFSAKRP
ncbi:hypothetical protein ACFWHT_10215 [Microbacterium sp. NPDC058342]|uniref:hypothetical protein n=1 Tax=Microbacterium sp. NPDC058342 TaxID=3346454 RepID=UPI0036514F9A